MHGRDGPVAWPTHSPDLSSIYFFLFWRGVFLEALIWETPTGSEENLNAKLSFAAATVRDILGIIERAPQSLTRRCQACIDVGATF
ncbi:hypothetical protein AVEN_58752-1 [Araneus ventricosus]|uniref:Uncharacterized protein n=1 Tax=Araneus ventricosus TaxID=182803 RepID=A0A4Y2G3G5_ARAVE|nr:hypothetical protein AVEN_58752-1 [Araneus ventricosus]